MHASIGTLVGGCTLRSVPDVLLDSAEYRERFPERLAKATDKVDKAARQADQGPRSWGGGGGRGKKGDSAIREVCVLFSPLSFNLVANPHCWCLSLHCTGLGHEHRNGD